MQGVNKYYNVLRNAGIQTDTYLSLQISVNNPGKRPMLKTEDGRVVYDNLLLRALNDEEISEESLITLFGAKSQFFGQIMEDGNVFNPFIHRRFLPHQYIDFFIRWHRICDNYKWPSYISRHKLMTNIIHECEQIGILEKMDIVAFKQRAACFPLPRIKEWIYDFYNALINRTRTYGSYKIDYGNSYVYISSYSVMRNEEVLHHFRPEVLCEKIEKCKAITSYREMSVHIRQMYQDYASVIALFNIHWDTGFFSPVIPMYYMSGAYFTLTYYLSFKSPKIPDSYPYYSKSQALFDLKKRLKESVNDLHKWHENYLYFNKFLKDILANEGVI